MLNTNLNIFAPRKKKSLFPAFLWPDHFYDIKYISNGYLIDKSGNTNIQIIDYGSGAPGNSLLADDAIVDLSGFGTTYDKSYYYGNSEGKDENWDSPFPFYDSENPTHWRVDELHLRDLEKQSLIEPFNQLFAGLIYNEGVLQGLNKLIIYNTAVSNFTTYTICDYLNITKSIKYGFLYNFYAVDTDKLAPTGWHVASDEEIKTLEMSLGMSEAEADGTGYRGTNEGSKLAGNAALWNNGNLENDSEFGSSGFTALPGGRRGFDGSFQYIGRYGNWWSATEYSLVNAYRRLLYYDDERLYRDYTNKNWGFSIRCLKDDSTDPGTVTDINGNTYNTIKIGNQVWMTENLTVTQYNDGTAISELTDATEWSNDTDGARCAYNNSYDNVFEITYEGE
jgi:uncharacterized protein (TIGR02145 family)